MERINAELTAVNGEDDLHSSLLLHNQIIKHLWRYFQNKFSDMEEELVEAEGSKWLALFTFIKDESCLEKPCP